MEEKCKFSYSDFDDSLIISCRDESYQYSENNMEEVGENFSFDDIVLNITKNGKIQGIIINNASQLIEESGIDSSILKNLDSIMLITIQKQNSLLIAVKFILKDMKEQKISLGRILMPQLKTN